jgi:fructosamine-3-kinase
MITSIPAVIRSEVEDRTDSRVTDFSSVSGGCINNAGKLTSSQGIYFIKWNDGATYPGMFEAEARGLSLLLAAGTLAVPKVIFAGAAGGFQFLLLEHIEEGQRLNKYWENFGAGLALLHRVTSGTFGLDHENYIGSLPQRNTPSRSWVDFFINHRITPQLRMAVDNGRLGMPVLKGFNSLFPKLPALLPEEPPSLLHGDLWSGNIMTNRAGKPCLIDPAVYFGHREVDVAMTRLFGGFDTRYLNAYGEVFPLLPGYEERLAIYNLYPLLVHVNLFGGGYGAEVVSTVKRFV